MRYVVIAALLITFAPGVASAEPEAPIDREADERDFRKRVDRAITKGAEWVAGRQADDGSFPHNAYDKNWPGGVTALAMLALLESELNVWSEPITKGMAALKRANLDRTYSAALGIMAMESYRVPQEERRARREGKEVKKLVRKLTKEEKAWVQKRLDLIVNGRQFDAWGYPGTPPPDTSGTWPGDLSNTQYALLGIKSASRCKVKADEEILMRILRIVLKAQEREGPRFKLVVKREETKEGYGREYARPVEVRGWRYKWPVTVKRGNSTQSYNPQPDDKPSGSMTCAGIACLAIIHSELYKSRRYRNKMRDVQKAIDDGFGWLAKNWDVEKNPGGKPEWHFYYLYGLERAGLLANRKWIGEHDWYREGAEYLLARQGGGGAWSGGSIVNTCFALLFLKRSTMPVTLTGLK